jgi:trimeric autotransporter adhesin
VGRKRVKRYQLILFISTFLFAELIYPNITKANDVTASISEKAITTTDNSKEAVQERNPQSLNEVENPVRNYEYLQVKKPIESSTPKENTTNTNNPSLQAQSAQAQSATTEPQPVIRPRVGASFTTEGSGTDQFAGFEGFIPLLQTPGENLTYLQGRLLLSTENSALGGNLLLGHRFLSDDKNYLVGGYVSYDNRNTGNAVFNQLGAGFEALSESLDFRTNFYLPIKNKSALLSQQFLGSSSFQGNSLALDTLNQVQEAFTGFDAEVGTRLVRLGSGDLRGYAGLYYYTSENIAGFVGARGRLVARPNDSLVAGLTLQSDAQFDTRLIFNIGVSLPGSGSSSRRSKQPDILARLGESPERQSSVTVDNLLVRDTVAAVNPDTGIPLTFQHVNLGLGNSNGTIESPFGTVQEALNVAKPGDIVYVRTGTNPGIPDFTIPNNVRVLSAALPRTFKTQIGNIQLPGSGSGVRPTITGTVTLSNNTTLDGFAITNSPMEGIFGENISNVSISNNTITNSASNAILLFDVTGSVNILDNTIDKTGINVDGSANSGISINNSIGQGSFLIGRNTVKNATFRGIGMGFSGNAGASSLDIRDNQITGNQDSGIYIGTANNSEVNTTISGNTATENRGVGIEINTQNDSKVNATISGNTTSSNKNGGIYVLFSNKQGNATISNNRVENNTDSTNPRRRITGVDVTYAASSTGNTTISNNTVSGTQGGGIELNTFENANVTTIISGNTVTGNRGLDSRGLPVAAVLAATSDNSQANVTIRDNTITNNLIGISATTNDSAKLTGLIESNNVTNNPQGGIIVTASLSPLTGLLPQNPRANVSLRNNTVTGGTTPPDAFGDVVAASFSNSANICLQARGNRVGTFVLGDRAIPAQFDTTPTQIVSRFAGTVAVEGGINAINTTNTIGAVVTSVDPRLPSIWSRTNVPIGSCGLGN